MHVEMAKEVEMTDVTELSAAETLRVYQHLKGLEAEAERQSLRPGKRRSAVMRNADEAAARQARERVRHFEDQLLGADRRMRPAQEVTAEDEALVERLGV